MTALLLACVLALPAAGDESDEKPSTKPRVVDLTFERSADRLTVVTSFRLENGITADVLERIDSGIETSFRHKVRVLARRDVPLTPRKELARTIVTTTAAYDSLTGQYRLTRLVEGKPRRKRDARPPVETSRTTDSVEEMLEWMSSVAGVPLSDGDRPLAGRGAKIKVESSLGRSYVMWVFPSTISASAEVELGE